MAYKLNIYIADQYGNYSLVHAYWSEDLDALQREAQRRKVLNPEYVAIIISYKPTDAAVVALNPPSEARAKFSL